MQKIILYTIISILFITNSAFAHNTNEIFKNLKIKQDTISLSVKDTETNATIYELNAHTPRVPASTQKIITMFASLDTLSTDYNYETVLYKSTNNDLYLKLSGDPLLTKDSLEKLISTAKAKNIIPKTFFIDDTAFDNTEWGEGWQWDDELNPLMPKYSIYNIDNNLTKLEIAPTENNLPARIVTKPYYPFTYINTTITNYKDLTSIQLKQDNNIPNLLSVNGQVAKLTNIMVPVKNPKLNFYLRLNEAIRKSKFEYFSDFKNMKTPSSNIYVVDTIEHPINNMLATVLKSSNNLVAESIFKTAGAEYTENTGSTDNSLKMLEEYFNKIQIDAKDIKIVDGSGVSKNNLMTSDFMTNFLVKISKIDNFDEFVNFLPTPGEGTLKNRMLYFKENLKAKTGTLSDNSAIAGYIQTLKGKNYAFDIMITNPQTSEQEKKDIEEKILRAIYINN